MRYLVFEGGFLLISTAVVIRRILNGFFAFNRKICDKIEPLMPQTKVNLFDSYEKVVAHYMNSRPFQVVIDVGGGKKCPFAKYRNPVASPRILCIDVSAEEMQYNHDVDGKIVANLMHGLPFGDENVDLIVSRSVLEHLDNLSSFIVDAKRVLKKDGYLIHLFPSKFALFAIINQMLPAPLSRRLLYFFLPNTKGICGFPALYDKCYYSAMSRLLKSRGFTVVDIVTSYYQSRYFDFFAPAFLVSGLYEIMAEIANVKNLGAYLLVVAKKE